MMMLRVSEIAGGARDRSWQKFENCHGLIWRLANSVVVSLVEPLCGLLLL